jgi:hypothetical protein
MSATARETETRRGRTGGLGDNSAGALVSTRIVTEPGAVVKLGDPHER